MLMAENQSKRSTIEQNLICKYAALDVAFIEYPYCIFLFHFYEIR